MNSRRNLTIEDFPFEGSVTRAELVARTGLSDRVVRSQINRLRKNPDTVIISSSHGRGYKRPSCVEELEMCLAESRSRVHEERLNQEVYEKAIRNLQSRKKTDQLWFDF